MFSTFNISRPLSIWSKRPKTSIKLLILADDMIVRLVAVNFPECTDCSTAALSQHFITLPHCRPAAILAPAARLFLAIISVPRNKAN